MTWTMCSYRSRVNPVHMTHVAEVYMECTIVVYLLIGSNRLERWRGTGISFSCLMWTGKESRSPEGLMVQFCHWCSGDEGLNHSFCICFFMQSRRLAAVGDRGTIATYGVAHKLRSLVISLGWETRSGKAGENMVSPSLGASVLRLCKRVLFIIP